MRTTLIIIALLLPACAHQAEQKRTTAAAISRADTSSDGYKAWLRGYIPTLTDDQLAAAQEVHRRAWAVLRAHDAALGACLGTMQPTPAPEVR
jgi:hypothetical protein